jgi:enamine deaminase RidA (YjgF/YER057c/UK114 family)
MRKLVSSGRPWEEKAGYSRAVRIGSIIEIGLTSPSAPDGSILHAGDVYAQTKASLEIIGEALAEAGASFEDVIKTNIMMLDTGKWAEAGRAHAEVFSQIRPALSFVGVSGFFDPLIEVEVEVTAVVQAGEQTAK